ncbi:MULTISPECIES: ATP-binding protein [unclassified Streptomyces]|uniref:ATP-binding protein n=1 Tax=unclassified Streptomyces TaxID=2593676 RepID=UPI0022B7124F|nr:MULTISPECIES: ATP-binding protein [unclassified Streptomyces]MCZ7417109.1 ATP-binding protein [Streptomyces sp. WMMC897]MCZ7433063.1 ATP-binding protein [Streptomyces sp. WMMC1477]
MREPGVVPVEVLQEDRLDYTPCAGSVRLARRRAARLAEEWGYPAVAGDAAVVVSELAGNALLHGCVPGRYFRVRLVLTSAVLRVEVSDPRGERRPTRRAAADDEMFGRGLLIVAHLATRWGVAPRTVGKTVWAELALR